ncbi:hypothetical protein J3Q64DRAFT_1774897 [Phycomyces blakesleeanus]|uniref:Uncharacterized protein n=1 Tax=Phycomyces blakesleeanus TaxID=4837 RepID=A0ABR3AIU6_PHYBL
MSNFYQGLVYIYIIIITATIIFFFFFWHTHITIIIYLFILLSSFLFNKYLHNELHLKSQIFCMFMCFLLYFSLNLLSFFPASRSPI